MKATLQQKAALARAAPLLKNIPVGGSLPSIRKIAAEIGINPAIVRGLLHNLVAAGYLELQGRRWLLRRPLPINEKQTPAQVESAPLSKKELVHNHLIAALSSGRLQPGAPLHEIGVARELGVSTVAVREALLELRPMGAFEKLNSRNWTVAAFDRQKILHLFEFRQLLETHALQRLFEQSQRMAVQEPLRANEIETRAILSDPKATFLDILRVDLAFHKLLLEASGNPYLLERGEFIYFIIEYQLSSPKNTLEQASYGLKQHLRILQAIFEEDFSTAEKTLLQHLRDAAKLFHQITES